MSRMTDDFDNPWKAALHTFLSDFIALFFPKLHRDIDWHHKPEFQDKEFRQITRDAKVGRSNADVLVKVWLKSGMELRILIHIEVQAQRDASFPERMYIYNYRAYDQYRIQILSIGVLADDGVSWRPDKFEYDVYGCKAGLKFPIVKLVDFREPKKRAQLERSKNPFAVMVLVHLKTQETQGHYDLRAISKLKIATALYEKGFAKAQIEQLLKLVDWLMGLPDNLERVFQRKYEKFLEKKKMPFVTIFEKVARERGLKEGREEGREEGLVQGLREGILDNLAVRFGSKPRNIRKKLESIGTLAKLKSLHRYSVAAESLSEFEARLPESGKSNSAE